MYYVYILLCDKAFFYVGITKDLEKRLKSHKAGYNLHTRRYSLIELVYTEEFKARDEAEKREKQIKGWSRAKKKTLIDGDSDKLEKLSKSKS